MKDSRHNAEVNDLISLVESEAWKVASDPWKINEIRRIYDCLKAAKRFAPPTEDEVQLFMASELKHWSSSASVTLYTASEAYKFVSFYSSKGWMVGKNKMKDWHADARGWLARNDGVNTAAKATPVRTAKSDDESLF